MAETRGNILEVRGLSVEFRTEEGTVRAVDRISFDVPRGKVLALVGESGCGKSVTAYSILRLIQPPGRIAQGSIRFLPRSRPAVDIAALHNRSDALYNLRGRDIGMVFQEPMHALSPVHTIGNQVCEAILLHQRVNRGEAEERAADALARVGIPGPRARLRQYPHELSGGMRQRAVIAMALAASPELLIADEPTTALDVTVQAQILGLIRRLQHESGISVILITHDFGVVAQVADHVAVMYLGRLVECAPVRPLMKAPRHPYTRALLESLPGTCAPGRRLPSIEGSVPPAISVPRGCAFHPRCRHAKAGLCDSQAPPRLQEVTGTVPNAGQSREGEHRVRAQSTHTVACFRAGELDP